MQLANLDKNQYLVLQTEYAQKLTELFNNQAFNQDIMSIIETENFTSDPQQAIFKEGQRSVIHHLYGRMLQNGNAAIENLNKQQPQEEEGESYEPL